MSTLKKKNSNAFRVRLGLLATSISVRQVLLVYELVFSFVDWTIYLYFSVCLCVRCNYQHITEMSIHIFLMF